MDRWDLVQTQARSITGSPSETDTTTAQTWASRNEDQKPHLYRTERIWPTTEDIRRTDIRRHQERWRYDTSGTIKENQRKADIEWRDSINIIAAKDDIRDNNGYQTKWINIIDPTTKSIGTLRWLLDQRRSSMEEGPHQTTVIILCARAIQHRTHHWSLVAIEDNLHQAHRWNSRTSSRWWMDHRTTTITNTAVDRINQLWGAHHLQGRDRRWWISTHIISHSSKSNKSTSTANTSGDHRAQSHTHAISRLVSHLCAGTRQSISTSKAKKQKAHHPNRLCFYERIQRSQGITSPDSHRCRNRPLYSSTHPQQAIHDGLLHQYDHRFHHGNRQNNMHPPKWQRALPKGHRQ